MLHKNITPQIGAGIKELRKRIGVPSSKLDETVNIATWNIREFGKTPRTDLGIHCIAEVLSNFDLIAITELRDNLSDLYRVMDILGPYWKVVFSDWNADRGGNRERIGYLYDKRAVVFTGLAAEVGATRRKVKGEYLPDVTWWRSPYMASFSAGNFDFILITAHIRWDKEENRIKPLKRIAEWIDKRVKDDKVIDKDIILMGDFNIPTTDDELFSAITSKGLMIPDQLRGVHGTNLAKTEHYDQILHYKKYNTLDGIGGAVDFYKDDWRALFPEKDYPDMTKKKFTFELSDHLPLWIQIDTWTDDEELDQYLSSKKSN